MHIEELNDLYSSPNIIRVIKSRRTRWAGHIECRGGERYAPEGKSPLERPRRKWEDNIKINLQEVG